MSPTLSVLLAEHPFAPGDPLVISDGGRLSLGDLRDRVDALAATLGAAGLRPGPSSLVVMFAVWAVGSVYVPLNARYTAEELASAEAEARLSLLVGAAG